MLRFLKLRKDDPELPLPWEEYGLGGDKVEASAPTDVTSGAMKKPKDEKVIVEELRCLTEELREHIMLLVRESEVRMHFNNTLTRQTFATSTAEPLMNHSKVYCKRRDSLVRTCQL